MEDAAVLDSLPDDPAILKSMVLTLARKHDDAASQRDEWHVKFLRAETELLRLKKWYYGPRADALSSVAEVNQMLLNFAGELEARPVAEGIPSNVKEQDLPVADAGGAAAVDPKTVRRVRRGRRNLARGGGTADVKQRPRIAYQWSDFGKLLPLLARRFPRPAQRRSKERERFEILGHFGRCHFRVQ